MPPLLLVGHDVVVVGHGANVVLDIRPIEISIYVRQSLCDYGILNDNLLACQTALSLVHDGPPAGQFLLVRE